MGFLSTLGKIAPIAASFIPGIGPIASTALRAAGAFGSVAGGAAGSRAQGRAEEARLLTDRDRNEIDKFGIGQRAQMDAGGLDLQRKGFGEQARGGRAKQALIASLLGNMQDVNVNVPGITPATISGGLRPSAMGEGGRGAMSELFKQAMAAQMTPDQFEGGRLLNAPRASALPKPSGLDKFLSIAGLVGSGLGALGPVLNPEGEGPQAPPGQGLVGSDLGGQPTPFPFSLADYRRSAGRNSGRG